MPAQYEEWRNFLIEFAKKIGKPDAEVYIEERSWKARQGKNKRVRSIILTCLGLNEWN